ncbi:MAG: nitroreductase family protein [Treponemataceae bacterium]
MELTRLFKERRSVRSYDPRPVEREKLEELAEAFRLAPSACNSQPWRIIFVEESALKDEVARATFSGAINFNRFAVGAPVLAVLVIEQPRLTAKIGAVVKSRDLPLLDVGIAASQFVLRACELGLGTCMLGWFDERKIRTLLGIPRGKRLALVITIGYPAVNVAVREKERKPLDEVRSYNRY